MDHTNALIPRQTLSQMAEAWTQAQREVTGAFELLDAARERLGLSFGQDSYRFHFDIRLHSRHYDKAEELIPEVKKDVWSALIGRMELRKIMSIADQQKLDKQLETGEGLPDITLENLLAMLETTALQIPQMIEASVKEIYEWLRPVSNSRLEYVTNQKSQWELKDKLILEYCVEKWSQHYHPGGYREAHLRQLDNVFHALDGKGLPKGHYGPLCEAIHKTEVRSDGRGETQYFRFRCFKNQNLHIVFKRMDLVAKLNAVAGGMRLKV